MKNLLTCFMILQENNFVKYPSGTESSVNVYHPHTSCAYFRRICYEAIDSVVSAEDTSAEQDFMKATYADDIDTSQLQIESDVHPLMFHNEKPECFNDIISKKTAASSAIINSQHN